MTLHPLVFCENTSNDLSTLFQYFQLWNMCVDLSRLKE